MDAEAGKRALREQFGPVVDVLGFKFSPDSDLVEFTLEQEIVLYERHGIPFCPCKGLTGVREEDMRKVCPCIPWNKVHFDKMKRCWCGLFVHKDVTDPDALMQMPETEME
ncbi:MAG: ferredoxin-thioredoxin reductase catalytic domain-containing protein [Methanomassiliicoccales archaeon]|jgi:ferredoxin-thioredoxin reductase catalytic subunit